MKKRILIVDDDREIVQALATRCQNLGLDVETAVNTLTAVTITGISPPDLICLDIQMPTGNGLSVCEFLANDPTTRGKPVIILTGCKDQGTIRRCGELNAHYVHKSPNYWEELEPLICRLLEIELYAATTDA